jgi:hypothetical protein
MTMKLLGALFALGTLLQAAGQAHAESNRVKFPEDLDKLVHYMTVKRGTTTEHLSTASETIDAVKAGRPVPNGTKFVLTEYRDDKLYRYLVMEKGEGWGADYKGRSGDWQFQWFRPDKQINMSENTSRCLGCHQSQRGRDFLFTARRLPDYNGEPIALRQAQATDRR